MAYNTAHSGNGFVLLGAEQLLQHHDNVEMELEGPTCPSLLKGTRKGNIHLTNQRLIFITLKNSPSYMKSFSMPFYYMKQVEVKQPIFGANKLVGLIKAQPNGGWEGQANFKFDFKSGGAIEFSSALLRVATKAPKQPPPAPGQAPPPQQQPNYYPQPMPNGSAPYGYPAAYPTAPPAGGYPPAPGGYPPQPGMAPPPGYPPAGTNDPAYPPPAYSEAVAGAGIAPSAPPPAYEKPTMSEVILPPLPSQQINLVSNSSTCSCGTHFGNPFSPCKGAHNHTKSSRTGVTKVHVKPFATVYGNPYVYEDPRYIQSGPPGGNAYYDPNNPQQAYIPQTAPAPQYQPPPYSEKPKME